MKLNCSVLPKAVLTIFFTGFKKVILLLAFTIVIKCTEGQRSNTFIYTSSASNTTVYGLKPDITKAVATLRKEVVKGKVEIKEELPAIEKEVSEKKESKKNIVPTPPVVVISTTVYDIPGTAAAIQYTSLQASFKFLFYDAVTNSVNSPTGFIELYKLEKGSSTRSFCIPAVRCTSVNIPIQITLDGQIVAPGISSSGNQNGAAGGKSPIYFVVIPSGYLSPGEYAFIDKSSLLANGAALACFPFSVR